MANLSEIYAPLRTSPPEANAGPAPPSPEAVEACFAAYNRHRRSRLDAQSGPRGAEALQMVPYLLHLNQPGLPGYVEDVGCPVGVADYAPSHADHQLARRLFPGAAPRRVGILRPVVELVAVMGSVGTIGFSGESDLDVWVCHAPQSGRNGAFRLFHQKVRAVEAWMNAHSGLEVHLFVQDAERIRRNDFGETDLEGCGSALGAILKEEFYRTGILLAGKVPFWWLVATGAGPEEYRRRIADLRGDPAFSDNGYVDLGWVEQVPLGELFGAAIWQIVKSWKSPFKSALKMGLLEKAVRLGKDIHPLCEILKDRVLAGDAPDPYRLLFDQVLAFYRSQGDAEAEDLLARCFYLKSGTRLDPDRLDRQSPPGGDEGVLLEYVQQWGWGARRVRHLNSLAQWKFEWVQALAKEIDRFFLRTYQRIRSALDESGDTQRITPRDLTILGRRLQTVYRRAPHKVETLHLVTAGMEESSLTLYQETLPSGDAPWMLFRGVVNAFNLEEKGGDLLRTSLDPLEPLVWAAQNRILTARTRLGAKGVEREISAADLEGLVQMLSVFVAENERESAAVRCLLEPPKSTRLVVVPNLGRDDDEVREIGALRTTSWGETFYRRWEGADAFRDFAQELLLPFVAECSDPTRVQVFAPTRKMGSIRGVHGRLHRELPTLAAFLGEGGQDDACRRRYLGRTADGYFVLESSGTASGYKTFRDREALLRYLSGVGPYRRVLTRVEPQSGDLAIIRALSETSVEGLIDIFVLREPGVETLLVVDEVGNLIHFRHAEEGQPYALAKLLLFLEAMLPELAAQPESPLLGSSPGEAVRIHNLIYEGTCRVLTSTVELMNRALGLKLRPRGLTIERTAGAGAHPAGYVITWGNQTIRSGEVPNPLEEVRKRIRETRKSGLDYDAFVTRLFLDERFMAEHCGPFITTGHYLFYKKLIEQRLSA